MKATGIVRRVDELGRIVIPKEIRKTLHMEEGTALEVFIDDDQVILRKYEVGDIFTGEMEDLFEYKGRQVSKKSIAELAALAGLI